MPDYGHPLEFGTFITPKNNPPQAAVELAVLSENLGYDLVTFQDHPYQPAFLDTWTLLSYVAAKTERVHLSANVLNLPLRLPSVVARAAASLDLLSDGRFELGLGAGGFWDAIAAMGGPRRTPGESVEALAEAIDVIRGIWDVGNRAPLRLSGEHYSVDGAKRGPAAAHDISIWLGAYKPRMLRLIGRKADGWVPSLGYMQPGDLRRGNATIDESAINAGRDPREIRRLLNIGGQFANANGGVLNGPPTQWVEELAGMALEEGIGTFVLASDDPAMIEAFAVEVMPAVRDEVARERESSGAPVGTVRRAEARAKRREGIDYEGVPASLSVGAVEPGDSTYSRVRSTYIRGGSPGLVLRPNNVPEVVEALAYARKQDVALAIRSAGHGFSGRSTNDGGIVIDLARLNTIEVLDEATRRVRIEPGAIWSAVATTLAPYGWALSSGDYGGVGVGGLATAGGIGWFAREHGLTIDHLKAVDIVLANGDIVHADDVENADLFWAVRGAGANFGVVVSFEFEVDEQSHDVGWAQLVHDATDVAGLLQRWGAAVEASPRDLTASLIAGAATPGKQAYAQVHAVVDSDDPDTIIERLQPLANVAPLLDQSVQLVPYSTIMSNNSGAGDQHGQGEPNSRSGLLEHITPEFAEASARLLASGAVHWYQLRAVGEAVSDVPADATAYANRSANFSLVAIGAKADRLDEAWAELREYLSGLYLSFETGLHDGRIEDAFPPATLERLRKLKRAYDPDNVFRDNFNIVTVDDA